MRIFFFLTILIPGLCAAECKEHVALLSPSKVASELGQSEAWVLANYKINLWSKASGAGRKVVGKMYPGSRAVILKKQGKSYKVVSPLDKSKGWVSGVQIERTLFQDTKTRNPCKKK